MCLCSFVFEETGQERFTDVFQVTRLVEGKAGVSKPRASDSH